MQDRTDDVKISLFESKYLLANSNLCLQNITELFPTNSAIPDKSPRNRPLSIGTSLKEKMSLNWSN